MAQFISERSPTALLSIYLKHAYFPRQEARPAFYWQEDIQAQEFIQQSGLVLKESPNAIHLFPNEDKLYQFSQLLERQDFWDLSFYLYSTHPEWISISELPLNYQPQKFILSPSRAELTPGENGLNPLFERSLASSKILAIDQHIDALDSEASQMPPSEEMSSNPPVSPPIEKENQDLQNTMSGFPPIAKIRIRLSKATLGKWQEAFKKSETPQRIDYHYHIANRKAYWFYWLCPLQSSSQMEIKKMEILSEDPEIRFEGPEEFVLEGGQKAYVFYSNQALPIFKKSPFRFELLWEKVESQNYQLQYEGQKHQTLTRVLPVASPQSLQLRSLKGRPCVAADIICQI